MDNPQLAFPEQQFRTPSSEHCEAKTYAQVLTLLTPASSWMAQVFQEAHLYSKFGLQWNTLSKDSNKRRWIQLPFFVFSNSFREATVSSHGLRTGTGAFNSNSSTHCNIR